MKDMFEEKIIRVPILVPSWLKRIKGNRLKRFKRTRTVWVQGRTTKIQGLVITPEFNGFDKCSKPVLIKRQYRVGTIDGYRLESFARLYAAKEFIEQCLEIGLKDFRPPHRARRIMRILRLRRNKNHPVVNKYFTLYSI